MVFISMDYATFIAYFINSKVGVKHVLYRKNEESDPATDCCVAKQFQQNLIILR